jgi:hypothetical protein
LAEHLIANPPPKTLAQNTNDSIHIFTLDTVVGNKMNGISTLKTGVFVNRRRLFSKTGMGTELSAGSTAAKRGNLYTEKTISILNLLLRVHLQLSILMIKKSPGWHFLILRS